MIIINIAIIIIIHINDHYHHIDHYHVQITFRGLESSLSFLVSIVSVASTSGRFLLTCRRKRFVRIIEIMRIIMIMMRKWRKRGMIGHFLKSRTEDQSKAGLAKAFDVM